MSDVVVETADEGEAAAALALTPQARGFDCEMLLARRGDRLLGAAAIAWRSWSDPAGFPFWVHVLPAARRQGVGRRLVEGALARVRGESPGLWSMHPQDPDAEGALFLEACGFEAARRQHFFEADVEAMLAVVEPLGRRWSGRGEPQDAIATVGLDAAPLEELGWLVSAEFGGGPLGALQRLQRRTRRQARDADDRSVVLLHGDAVAGVMLCRLVEGRYVVEGRVIAPLWRNRWPNLVLLQETARRARDEGVTRFRFHCDSDVADTLKLARRCGADETSIRVLHYQAVAPT